ncbi:hypothetical protein BGX28_010348, partial [Mortierella sp. GBA30]
MLGQMRQVDLAVSVRAFLENPTLYALARVARGYEATYTPPNVITVENKSLTPEMLPLIVLNQSDIDRISQNIPGGVSNIQDIYALTPLQEGILFHHLLAKEGDPYLLTSTIAFETRTLLDRYIKAFQTVVDRHDILRTSFFWKDLSTSAQVVSRSAPLPILEFSLDPVDGPINEQLNRRFNPKSYSIDVSQAPLLRFIVAQESDGRWLLMQLVHHLIGDHAAEEEIHAEIKAILDGHGSSLPAPLAFRDHLALVRMESSPDNYRQFFEDMLAEVDEPTWPFNVAAVSDGGIGIKESYQILPQELNSRLRLQAKQLRVNLATLCHVAWAQVLARTSGNQRVVFGTVLFGRLQAGNGPGHALGLSMNTLPFRCDVDDRSVQKCVRDTHTQLAALLEHEHASLALAQRCSGVPAGTPLFSGLLNYRHSTPLSTNGARTCNGELVSQEGWFEYPGLEFLSSQERTNYPFALSVEDFGTALGLTAQTMDPADPARLCAYMKQALESLADALETASNIPIQQLEVLPVEERELLLWTWNSTTEDYATDDCLHHLFEQQVERTPHAVAVVHEGQSLTYAELNTRANCLAHQLIELGIQPDTLVAICVERSFSIIVGTLAILKAGGAYVPLDPTHASGRLLDILSDSAPSILIADSYGMSALQRADLTSLKVVDPGNRTSASTSNPRVPNVSSHNLAYAIYTSGSTGKPKGVLVEHRHVTRLFNATSTAFEFSEHDTWCLFHSFAFDFSVWEIWGALRYGGKLVIVSQSVARSPQDFYHLICEQSVTVLNMTPSAFMTFTDTHITLGLSISLRYVVLGGEALVPAMLKPWFLLSEQDRPKIVNMYGITETTVHVTYRVMTLEDCDQSSSVIGVRIPDMRTYVQNGQGQHVPLGAVGELYIGGAGVARGYLNRAQLTAERFLPDPYVEVPEARIYRTGDLVRYLPDGSLVYLGRNDQQVKIRGFRIELGEIEARLTDSLLVSEAVVVALGEGSTKRLIAYIVVKSNEQVGQSIGARESSPEVQLASILRSHLEERLPEYMIPSAFVRMDSFPLTSNGKIDRRALPEPGESDIARRTYEKPQGEIEEAIAAMWADLLRVNQVSRNDSFFAIGGHSLLAVRLMNRVSSLGVNIPLSSLFASPSLSAFAVVVMEHLAQGESAASAIVPVSRDSLLPLSFAQQRLWFLTQLEEVSDTYHIPSGLRLQGDLNQVALKHALDSLHSRHEALRSVFIDIDGHPQVKILPSKEVPLRQVDLRGLVDQDAQLKHTLEEETRVSFDLAKGPLIRATTIQLADDECVLLITQHHIVSDGWSMGIMFRELSKFYTACCNEESNPLPPLAIQYPDYAAWQRQWLSGDRLKAQSNYWRTTLSGAPVLIDLPTDRPRPPQQSFQGDFIPIEIDAQTTSALKQLSQKYGVTLFMTIMCAWSLTLSRLSGQDDIVVGTPSANRGRSEIEPLIGFFVNTLALRIDLSGEPTTQDLLERIRRTTLASYANQDLPFEQVVEIVQPPRRMDHSPLFQVMFVWQNNEADGLDLPGINVTAYDLDFDKIKFDLELVLYESGDGITGSLNYAVSLFDRATIERHIGYLQVVLQAMILDTDIPLSTVNILSSEECTRLETWNATSENYPADNCLHHLFEQQVEHTPNAIAVAHEDQSMTYAELNTRANCLAYQLIELGVQPDTLVAICVERSFSTVVSILAILKAGGAYLPLDPFYAGDRLREVLQDAMPTIIIADRVGRMALGDLALASLTVLDPNTDELPIKCNPHIAGLTSRHLAYVIYTSGSTGKPKGVMIEHQGAVNLVYNRPKLFNIRPDSRVLQFTSVSFDHSMSEIFSTLHGGASLYLLADDIRLDRVRLWDHLAQNSITHVSFTPSLLQDCKDMPTLECLRGLIVMGEAMPPSLPGSLKNVTPNTAIFNDYGPTECSVAATVWKCTTDFVGDEVPIGTPLPNKTIYLLDAHGHRVPLGAIGEMYIGGIGIARGYLNRADLTAERFLPDPFSGEAGARMYKTGDVAKYLPDGNIVCLGRNDYQVKIRGFRIELGEIEARLTENHLVSEAVVVALGEVGAK